MRLTTPFGNTSAKISKRRTAETGDFSEGFTTTVFPARSAGTMPAMMSQVG
jgi:hypothetical protein